MVFSEKGVILTSLLSLGVTSNVLKILIQLATQKTVLKYDNVPQGIVVSHIERKTHTAAIAQSNVQIKAHR